MSEVEARPSLLALEYEFNRLVREYEFNLFTS